MADKPLLVGGVGEINFGKQYRQGNRVYDGDSIAMCLNAQPVGNAGGHSYLYLTDESEIEEEDEVLTEINEVSIETKPFNYVSLFSGIGGFEQALSKIGGNCVLASEIDKFANQAYKTLYGDPTVGDITQIDAKDVPDHDVLVGGFPCQSFSVAGKRGGFDDARGTLFFEVARLAAEKKPKLLLLENVKGLVGHDKGKTLDTIVKTLNQIGYHVDFNVLNSKYFGVPQNRERIFIVAIRDDLAVGEPWNIEGTNVVAKGKRRISEYDDTKTFNFDWPEQAEVTTRLRDILETDVDKRYYLSEEKTAKLVAQLEAKEGVINSSTGVTLRKQASELSNVTNHAGTLMARDYKGFGNQDMTGVIEPQMLGHVDLKGHDAIKRVYSAEGVSPTLTTMGGGHREPKIAEAKSVGNTNPSGNGMNGQVYDIDAGLSPTLTTNKGEGAKLFEEVRPVLTPDRIEKRQNGRRFKDDGEESFTLTAQDRHGIAEGIPPKYRIRKLTPLECFRLQGFPDSAHQTLVNAGISNSQRYKMAGNAVTVNVIEALGERLLPYL